MSEQPRVDDAEMPSTTRPWPARLWVLLGAVTVTALAAAYLVGGALAHSAVPGTCTAWDGCVESAREEWFWDKLGLFDQTLTLATVVVVVAFLWGPLAARPDLRRTLARIALLLLVPLTLLGLVLVMWIAGNTCGDSDFLCLGGTADAVVLAVPTGMLAAVTTLLVIGLGGGRVAGTCSTMGLSLVAAGIAAWVVSTIVSDAVGSVLQPLLS